jgi:hypothetical protein
MGFQAGLDEISRVCLGIDEISIPVDFRRFIFLGQDCSPSLQWNCRTSSATLLGCTSRHFTVHIHNPFFSAS